MKYLPRSAVMRLATTYLAIIMVMSIGSSIVFYAAGAYQLDRRPVANQNRTAPIAFVLTGDMESFLEKRAVEGKAELASQLFLINLMILVLGGVISYLLAERTLQPIDDNLEAQAQFISDASHELRTPLTALRVNNEVAARDAKLTLTRAREVLHENVEDTTRLQQLTDALLDLLKDDDRVHVYDRVAMRDVVADAIDTIAPQAVEKKIGINDKIGNVFVQGNRAQLAQVLVILLDNAVKYSNANKKIHITAKKQGRNVSLSVKDSGRGIAAEDIDHVFTRFYRADKSRAKTADEVHGYGLGLAIAKKIIETHGGSISVTSALKQGSTFTIVLPATK